MEFAYPRVLWMFLVLVPVTAWYVYQTMKGGATLKISSVSSFLNAPKTVRWYLRHVPFVLRLAALAFLIIAIARPQSAEHNTKTNSEGIDIVLAVDVSGSMLARDFKPDRITAAKEVAAQFIARRYGDRIGLVVFAGESYTQSPLTTDQSSLQTLLARMRGGVIEDGTAIGNGLATALNRLRESDAKSKVVILLTDGVNNRGQISPQTAADIAKELGVKVYTIGVGKNGEAPYPVFDDQGTLVQVVNMKVEIDEKVLRDIASKTGGEYFRATNKQALKAIYEQIDSMEKSKVEIQEYTIFHEEFLPFVLLALLFLALEFIVGHIILKRIP